MRKLHSEFFALGMLAFCLCVASLFSPSLYAQTTYGSDSRIGSGFVRGGDYRSRRDVDKHGHRREARPANGDRTACIRS